MSVYRRNGQQPVGREFRTASGLFGSMNRNPRGYEYLELDVEARLSLARENNSRLVTSEIRRYMQ